MNLVSTRSAVEEDVHVSEEVPVAVVMITLNEAHNLDAVLQNVRGWASQIFIVDSYSSDATVDIALRHGAQIVQRAFRGFGDQWNFALRELPITQPWTMKLDPDERLTDELKASIATLIRANGPYVGINVQRQLWFMSKALPIRHRLLRVWRTGSCRFSEVLVNEHPHVAGERVSADGDLEHHDSPDLDHWFDKQNRYSTAEAITAFRGDALAASPRLCGSSLERRMWLKQNYTKLPFRYSLIFLYCFVIKGAWRAGWVGLAWSRLRSDVYRMREYKLREMRITGREPARVTREPGTPDLRIQQY